VEEVVTETEEIPAVAADDTTLRRWKTWFHRLSPYWLGALAAIALRFHLNPVEQLSSAFQSAHHRLGHLVGDAPGWLARVVRPVVNSHLWVHTRSAFLSAARLR